MSEFVLTPAERELLQALNTLRVRYLLVGMGAALIEGATGTTQDLDLWFGSIDPASLSEAARREGLDRIDLVLSAQGLGPFEDEYARAREYVVDDVPLRVLPLERVIASKKAANRAKDAAQIPLLEAALAARRETEGHH